MATRLLIHGTLTTHIDKAGTDIVRLVVVSREGHTMLISWREGGQSRSMTVDNMNNQQTTSPLKIDLDVMQSHPLCRTHFGQYQASSAGVTGRWGLLSKCSQVAGVIQKVVENPRKHRLFVQLSFVTWLLMYWREAFQARWPGKSRSTREHSDLECHQNRYAKHSSVALNKTGEALEQIRNHSTLLWCACVNSEPAILSGQVQNTYTHAPISQHSNSNIPNSSTQNPMFWDTHISTPCPYINFEHLDTVSVTCWSFLHVPVVKSLLHAARAAAMLYPISNSIALARCFLIVGQSWATSTLLTHT